MTTLRLSPQPAETQNPYECVAHPVTKEARRCAAGQEALASYAGAWMVHAKASTGGQESGKILPMTSGRWSRLW